MNARQQDRRCLSPKSAGWWVRFLVAGGFTFYLNYVPIHLATAAHRDGVLESVTETVFHHQGHEHDDADHSHDSDHHVPHPASDHTLALNASAKAPSASIFAAFFLPAIASVRILGPTPKAPIPIFERGRPPGESPPDPLQPRAPPLA